ncbi:hypothetical protein HYH03_001807 [Edaphochlamys debaryana]|uniref:Ysc84 actin-binding domain-containing protein n=1 Tax=Edaphochlamys debaryana TaxID=47281 RepID=A0A836C5U7_9CHLO|nr:hypothetical protein HYH03_001807 [Edaphochlamys debaryana]|eukprot:KAG2500229.1 hypothetical protein HYH03_001807 [Edaphochlamys debaryana]
MTAETAKIKEEAQWAAGLVEKLANTDGDVKLNGPSLAGCKGVAFLKAAKASLGVTVARGNGFVIRKIAQQDDATGRVRWSAPVFFEVSQLGVGVSLGFQSVTSCQLLLTDQGVSRFAGIESTMGVQMGVVNNDGTGIPAGTVGVTTSVDTTISAGTVGLCYSLAEGLLVDFSFNGTDTRPDTEFNDMLYGSTHVADVLAGMGPTFPEMQPVYDALSAVMAKK